MTSFLAYFFKHFKVRVFKFCFVFSIHQINHTLKRHPLLLALLGLVSGISLAGFLAITFNLAVIGFAFSLLILLAIIFLPSARNSPSYFLLFALLGTTLSAWQDERFASNHYSNLPSNPNFYAGKLLSSPNFTKKA